MSVAMPRQQVRLQIRSKITCPHCWHRFPTARVEWIAAHPDLFGDPQLGPEAMLRFLPTRFTHSGNALDSAGVECKEIACPNCHLRLPRAAAEQKPCFISIAGSPSSGKSFLLAAMAWQARHVLPKLFNVEFADADAEFNRTITNYENQLFYAGDPDQFVTLSKTQETGDHYNTVRFGQMAVTLPQPFVFSALPTRDHPRFEQAHRGARLVCWYDNAGESFQPGKDTANNAVTQHLGAAHAWMFCYDLTQNPHVREKIAATRTNSSRQNVVTYRQEPMFFDMLTRIRKHANLTGQSRTNRPLIVVCTKFDAWSGLTPDLKLTSPYQKATKQLHVLNHGLIKNASAKTRELLSEFAPDLVTSAEAFSENVYYLPVSATGSESSVNEETGQSGFRCRDLKPVWCELPMLLALAFKSSRLVGVANGSSLSDAIRNPNPAEDQ